MNHFVSFSYLTALARTFRTMLNKSRKSKYPSLVPDPCFWEKSFNFSLLSIRLVMGLSYMFFVMLIYNPYISRTTIFISALFTITKIVKQPKYSSTDEWIKKMCSTHKVEYYPLKRREYCNLQQGNIWRWWICLSPWLWWMILWMYGYIQMNQILYIKGIQFFVHQLYLNKAIMRAHTHTHTQMLLHVGSGASSCFQYCFHSEVEEAPGDGTWWQGQCPG